MFFCLNRHPTSPIPIPPRSSPAGTEMRCALRNGYGGLSPSWTSPLRLRRFPRRRHVKLVDCERARADIFAERADAIIIEAETETACVTRRNDDVIAHAEYVGRRAAHLAAAAEIGRLCYAATAADETVGDETLIAARAIARATAHMRARPIARQPRPS